MLNDLNKVPKPIVNDDIQKQIEQNIIHWMQK